MIFVKVQENTMINNKIETPKDFLKLELAQMDLHTEELI